MGNTSPPPSPNLLSSPATTTNLDRALNSALARRRAAHTLRSLTLPAASSIDFSSNDFLSLSTNAELRTRFTQHFASLSSPHLGSGGSRLLDGNSVVAEQLEHEIAAFHGAPAGLLCNSGFDANVGLFSCLPQPGDVVVYDEFIHASVHDGMRASRAARCIPFPHNCVDGLRRVLKREILGLNTNTNEREDDSLQHLLSWTPSSTPPSPLTLVEQQHRFRSGTANIFIAVEGVYSMDGDIAPLAAISTLLRTLFPHNNAHLIVDEAHSTGLFGSHGRGLVSSLNLETSVAVRLHTFGKALACNGAILLTSPLIRHYLLNYARPLIYTTFLSFPCLAAIRASYDMLRSGHTDMMVARLRALMRRLHARLLAMQAAVHAHMRLRLRCPAVCPETPIFAVCLAEPRALAAWCQTRGYVVRAIVPPTVPVGTERVRICLHAGNSADEVDALVACIATWVGERSRELGGESAEMRGGARL